jgi:rhodanese-related sulfurtransferase
VSYFESVVVADGPPAQLAGATLVNTAQVTQSLRDRDAGTDNFDLIDARGCTSEPTIPGSLCLDPNTIEGFQDKIPDKTTRVVIFCHDGKCPMSYSLAAAAVAAGYSNIYWYRGGINAWMAAGNPTTTLGAG